MGFLTPVSTLKRGRGGGHGGYGRASMEEYLRKEAIRRHLFGKSPIDVYTEEHELRPSSTVSPRLPIHCKVGSMTLVRNLEVST
jgi:hypothetical protein